MNPASYDMPYGCSAKLAAEIDIIISKMYYKKMTFDEAFEEFEKEYHESV